MVHLLLVRHGETDWNIQQRYLGHADLPLNPTGESQADALAQRLAGQAFSAAYASDLRRAASTAARLRLPIPLTLDPRLRELDFGAFEGLTYQEAQTGYNEAWTAWVKDPNSPPPGGESLRNLVERVGAFLEDLRRADEKARFVVIAHGGPLRVLLCLALDVRVERSWQFRLDPASITTLDLYGDGAILSGLNDTTHLPRVSAHVG